jgi:hypothetical protein
MKQMISILSIAFALSVTALSQAPNQFQAQHSATCSPDCCSQCARASCYKDCCASPCCNQY